MKLQSILVKYLYARYIRCSHRFNFRLHCIQSFSEYAKKFIFNVIIGKDINSLCRRCLNGYEIVEHLLFESLTISRGRIFGQGFGDFNKSHMSQWTYFDGLPQNYE
jgi:hypothetical protein